MCTLNYKERNDKRNKVSKLHYYLCREQISLGGNNVGFSLVIHFDLVEGRVLWTLTAFDLESSPAKFDLSLIHVKTRKKATCYQNCKAK